MNLPVGLDQAVKHFERAAKSPATRKAYASDCRVFASWCSTRSIVPFPAVPVTVAAFLADEAGRCSTSTLGRRIAALSHLHRAKGWPSPIDDHVRAVLAGTKRELGTAPRPRAPLVAEDLVKMLGLIGDTLADTRDRALLLVGWFGALRRSEIAGIERGHVEQRSQGLVLTIPRSKTDQEGQGQQVALLEPAAGALLAWLERGHVEHGPVFRRIRGGVLGSDPLSTFAIAKIVKRRARRAGIDTALISAHSLRSGALTSGALAGANIHKLKELSRHRSLNSLSRYVRPVELFQNHALAKILG